MSDETPVNDPVTHFKEKKYVVVDSVLNAEQCKELTEYFHYLVENKKTTKDSQCPLSESVYGDPVFDTVLEQLRPAIESATGLQLLSTYSYARKYAPGDELKPHLDRESCEISATLTLGFDGEVWPIHVSENEDPANDIGELNLPVGSLVVYRGMEINHWREPYTQGNWQCQIFLHYVDANGPYKNHKFDKREDLGAKPTKQNVVYREEIGAEIPSWQFGYAPKDKYLFLTKTDVLSRPLIDSIILYGSKHTEAARVGPREGEINKKIRNVSHTWLPFENFEWLYSLVEDEIRNINWINFKFVLSHMEKIDYLEYHADDEGGGKYSLHLDGGINSTRKLSFSILLSDPSEYDGGDLVIYDANLPTVMPKRQGMITFFPSNVLHEVTPVTRGVRRSIVSWAHGPVFC